MKEQTSVGAKKNIITINGRTYDTVTGHILETKIEAKAPAKTSSSAKVSSKPLAGMVVTPQPKTHAPAPVAANSPDIQSPNKPKKIAVTQHAERDPGQRAHKIHVKTQRAKTLVRNGLAKPITKKTIAVTGLAKQPSHQVIIGRASSRSESASHHLKSKQITKFNHGPQVTHRTADMPVKAAPGVPATQKKQTASYNIRDTPPTLPTHSAKARHTPAPNIFEEALAAATSHKTSHKTSKRKGHRLRQAGVLAASVVVLGGFFAYQNAPRIALYSASSKIGFKAALPRYQPSGFGLSGAVQYQQGLVLANYRSNSDDRAYTIAQTRYTLDDRTLVAGLAAEQKAFQTEVVAGRPVYVLSNGATWIENGVRYIVEGNAGLTKEQLTKIAASI